MHIVSVTGGAVYVGEATGTVTIHDSDTGTTGQPMLEVDGSSQFEGNGSWNVQFRVVLSKPATAPLTIVYTTADGTGTVGVDYIRKTGTLTIAAGRSGVAIDVAIPANVSAQAARTLRLVATITGTGANITSSTATATIYDEDWA